MKSRRGGVVVALLMILVAITTGVALKIYSITRSPLIPGGGLRGAGRAVEVQRSNLNFLVIGLDEVEDVNRADSILFVRLDLEQKAIRAMSIPRDTRVQIRGHGQQKINHAYAYGGMDLLKETVINLTGMPVDYYVILNYQSFPHIVDAVGGVTVDVPKAMRYTDRAQGLYIDIKPGVQHMDGAQALKFVRFRMDALGDIGRMQRQQQFARALIDKVLSPSIIPRLKDLAESVLAMIQTDVPIETGLQLMLFLAGIDRENMEFFTMPGSAAYIDRVSYWIPDLQRAAQRFNPEVIEEAPASTEPIILGEEHLSSSAIAEIPQVQINDPIAVLNGEGTQGLSAQFSKIFERAGIEVGYVGNARHFDYRYSVVYYPQGQDDGTARDLALLCGIPASLVRPSSYSHRASLVIGHDYQRIRERIQGLPVQN